jgi:hypothetical protein
MDKQVGIPRLAIVAAVVVGVAGGSYGIASAASGGNSSSGSTAGTASSTALSAAARGGPPSGGNPWGRQRSDESLLTGDAKASAQAAALAKVPNGTIVRIETDADGNAPYEAHMTKTDGTPVTVYVDKQFNVVDVDSR